jgi:curved DNA-binding protein CbpA
MSDYYELLGVSTQATAAEIRQAYARLARDRHPDRFPDPEAKQRAQADLQELTTAFNALLSPRSRQEYDASRNRPVLRTPQDIARDAYERAQPAAREAIQALERATQLAPTNAAAFADLAAVLARQGMRLRAQKALEAAQRLAPRDPRVARVAAELGRSSDRTP